MSMLEKIMGWRTTLEKKLDEKEQAIEKDGHKGKMKIMRQRSAQGWFMAALGFAIALYGGWKLVFPNWSLYLMGFIVFCCAYLVYQDITRYKELVA